MQDVITIVLANLDYESTVKLCSVSSEYKGYCTDNMWHIKVETDYPYWAKYRPLGNMSYKLYYLELSTQYYIAVGSERFTTLATCLDRSIFRNSDRLIKYFISFLDDTEYPFKNNGRYLSNNLIKKYLPLGYVPKDMLRTDRIKPENVRIFVDKTAAFPLSLEVTGVKELDVIDEFGNLDKSKGFKLRRGDVGIQVGMGGNLEIIDMLKNSIPLDESVTLFMGPSRRSFSDLSTSIQGKKAIIRQNAMGMRGNVAGRTVSTINPTDVYQIYVPYIATGAGLAGNYQLFQELGGISNLEYQLRDGCPPNWNIVKELIQKHPGMIHTIMERLDDITNPDPNYLIDCDQSYYNLIKGASFSHPVPGRPLQASLYISEHIKALHPDFLVEALGESPNSITLARYLIEEGHMTVTGVISVIFQMHTGDNPCAKYALKWARSIRHDPLKEPLIILTYGHYSSAKRPFVYILEGVEYPGVDMSDRGIGVDIGGLIKVVHNIEGNVATRYVDIDRVEVVLTGDAYGDITYTLDGVTNTFHLDKETTVSHLLDYMPKLDDSMEYIVTDDLNRRLQSYNVLFPGSSINLKVVRRIEPINDDIL